MALKKSKTLKDGTTGEYWKITGMAVDRLMRAVRYQISLFLNQEASNNGAHPMQMTKQLAFALTPEEMNGDLVAVGYNKIKAQAAMMVDIGLDGKPCAPRSADPDLAGSEDV